MKLLLYSTYIPGGTDGTSNTSRQLVPALEEKGINVTMCTSSVGWPPPEISAQRSEKVRIYRSWFNSSADFCPGISLYFRKNLQEFDIVQLDGFYNFPTILGSYYASKYKIPYLICPRGARIPTRQIEKTIRRPKVKSFVFKLLSRRTLEGARYIVCTSRMEEERLYEQLGLNNYTYINNGLDVAYYSKHVNRSLLEDNIGIAPQRPIFLFLGRLAYEKALTFLLDVWKMVVKKIPDALLVMAGKSYQGYQEVLLNRIANIRCSESVVLSGSVSGDLKLALLQWSRCLLLPSYAESFGNVVLESLASGTPVIASVGTPWKELEDNQFGKWLMWDAERWAEAMVTISSDEKYQDENFRKRSQQWVAENYSWSKVAERYVQLYGRVLKGDNTH